MVSGTVGRNGRRRWEVGEKMRRRETREEIREVLVEERDWEGSKKIKGEEQD